MTGVDKDLATLREALAIGWPEGDHAEPHVFTEALDALARVRDSLERLQSLWLAERELRLAEQAAHRQTNEEAEALAEELERLQEPRDETGYPAWSGLPNDPLVRFTSASWHCPVCDRRGDVHDERCLVLELVTVARRRKDGNRRLVETNGRLRETAEAAEARCARLQQALDIALDGLKWQKDYAGPDGRAEAVASIERAEALAGPDTLTAGELGLEPLRALSPADRQDITTPAAHSPAVSVGPDTPADHNEEGHAKRPSGDPACDGGSVRAGSVVRPVDGGGGRPDRGRAARSVWQTLGDTPADSQEPEVCVHCGSDIEQREGRWRAVESRYPNDAHCHYSARGGKSVGHQPADSQEGKA